MIILRCGIDTFLNMTEMLTDMQKSENTLFSAYKPFKSNLYSLCNVHKM